MDTADTERSHRMRRAGAVLGTWALLGTFPQPDGPKLERRKLLLPFIMSIFEILLCACTTLTSSLWSILGCK
jgi:hypothetical protein